MSGPFNRRFLLEVQQLILEKGDNINSAVTIRRDRAVRTVVDTVRLIPPGERNIVDGAEITFGGWDITTNTGVRMQLILWPDALELACRYRNAYRKRRIGATIQSHEIANELFYLAADFYREMANWP